MMSDINEPTQALGRGDLNGKMGGNPGGVVSGETFRWWQQHVEAHPDATDGGKSHIETLLER